MAPDNVNAPARACRRLTFPGSKWPASYHVFSPEYSVRRKRNPHHRELVASLHGSVIQIAPQMRILVAVESVDGRKGIDSLRSQSYNELCAHAAP